jgi:hypothetical protein
MVLSFPHLAVRAQGRQNSCRFSSERGVAAVEREFGPLKARVRPRSFRARSLARVRVGCTNSVRSPDRPISREIVFVRPTGPRGDRA